MCEFAEPKVCHRRENRAFARYRVGENHIECRQAIGGDNEQIRRVDGVDVAHFATAKQGQAADGRFKNSRAIHG